jgi:peptidyl-prolyl cis-trans isomerase SurA
MLSTLVLLASLAAAEPPASAPAAAAPPATAAPAAPAAPTAAAPPGRVLDRVAAVLNGEVITQLELEDRAGPDLRRAEAQPPGPGRDRARAKALRAAFDAVVAERLFASQVQAMGVEITDQEIDAVIEDVKRRNNLDDARLDQALQSQGLDRPAYRKAVKRDLESMRILSLKVRNRVKVTDEDVKAYWQTHPQQFQASQEVRVRLIYVAAGTDEARARQVAQKALARVRSGEDFGVVARQMSEGPSAAEGGELGWLHRGSLQAELEKVALSQAPGQISDLVRTRAGFFIIQTEERRGGGLRPLEEVKDEIRDRLMNEQADNYRAQFVAELRKDAAIDMRMPELKVD